MNKYIVSTDSSNYDRYRRLDSIFIRGLERCNSIHSEQASEESGFFSDDQYKEHSKQLVNALSKWAQGIKFVTCSYHNGELHIDHEIIWKPNVPYIGCMLQHLDSAYKDIFPDIDQIQSDRNVICNEIRYLMTTNFGPIPHKPSYDMILSDCIKKSCPNLKKTINRHRDIDQSNFYFHDEICKIVFETVRDNLKLELTIRPSPFDELVDLVPWNATIARGNKESILKLKLVLETMLSSEEIHSIVKQYHELKRQLDNNQNIDKFKDIVVQFHDFIHAAGPTVLGGPGSCDICSRAEFRIK